MPKITRKSAIFLLILLVILPLLTFHKIIGYGIKQGLGQMNIILHAESIETVLKNNQYPDSIKYKLEIIREVKQFAIDSIGIKPSDNYNTIYNQHHQPILYTVTACKPYAFEAKEWVFPFLGAVPYKGFFDKKEAEKEIRSLKIEGYNVDVYSPSAWSTLGWFKDPILSNMLYKSEAQLANLIIHELTHGTLFIKNDVTFNENLANFIAEKGTELFLQKKFGKQSKQLETYLQKKEDEKIFTNYILKSKENLDSLYASTMEESQLKEKKKEIITQMVRGLKKLPLSNKKGYFKYSLQAFQQGNAFFMNFSRYDSQFDFFEKDYKELYHADLFQYMTSLKEKYPSL